MSQHTTDSPVIQALLNSDDDDATFRRFSNIFENEVNYFRSFYWSTEANLSTRFIAQLKDDQPIRLTDNAGLDALMPRGQVYYVYGISCIVYNPLVISSLGEHFYDKKSITDYLADQQTLNEIVSQGYDSVFFGGNPEDPIYTSDASCPSRHEFTFGLLFNPRRQVVDCCPVNVSLKCVLSSH